MNREKALEWLDVAMARYEECGLLIAEDMQMVFEHLGICREVRKGDNVVHAMAAVHLAVIREALKEDE